MRLVILTYESHQANLMTQRLLTEFSGQVVGIVASEVIVAKKNTWQAAWFLLRQTGLGFVALKGMEIMLSRAAGLFFALSRRQPRVPSLAQMAAQAGIPLVGAKNVNTPALRQIVQSWQPDLLISVYLNQLIGARLIAIPRQGVINVHPALLPRNRGLFPYFWALANGDTETGVTVHWVEPKFDTGPILVQTPLPIEPDDTVISLAGKSAALGADLLVQAVRLIAEGNPPRLSQDETQASYFSWPTPAAVRRFRQRGRRYGSLLEIWKELTQWRVKK
jgi:folate-dependent phosphoribosylglycinamide formyltransferase PurN